MMERAARPGEGGEGWEQFSGSQTAFGASVRAIGSYIWKLEQAPGRFAELISVFTKAAKTL